jgi:hypothetical protein
VRVRARGATVLQPGVDLLVKAEDFPRNGPILIITDGQCDRFRVSRDHAFLLRRQVPSVPAAREGLPDQLGFSGKVTGNDLAQ